MTVQQKTVAVVAQETSRWEEQRGNGHDDNSTQGATVAAVTQGTSRGEEHTGNTHDDNSTQTATVAVVTQEPVVVRNKQETPTMIILHKEQQL